MTSNISDDSGIASTNMDRDKLALQRGYSVPKRVWISDEYYPCCGFFEVHSWGNPHPPCSDVVKPYQQHQPQISTEICMYCGQKFVNPIDYFCHQDSMHYGIHTVICALCRGVFVSEAMLGFHITDCHGGLMSFKDALALKYARVKKQ